VVAIISGLMILGLYFYSNYQVQLWTDKYDQSKKEIVKVLKQEMDIDIKQSKRVLDIVAAAQGKLEDTKKVCFSFSQANHAYLQHLQELFSKIDRDSLGLDMKKLSLLDKQIILQGKVRDKDYDALETFEEELMELPNFVLKDRLRETSFTAILQLKETEE